MRSSRTTRSTLAGTALAVLLTGCAATGDRASSSPAGGEGTLPTAHVHAAAVDPGDGRLLLATHEGLIAIGDDGRPAPVGPVIDLMGFTVAGPDHYLASGHPGLRTDLPNPVGLIESTDGGDTWTPLSRAGESDFHALTTLPGGGVLGYDGTLRRTADGSTWEQLSIPVEPHTLTTAPDGAAVLATTAQGLLRSIDTGSSWAPVTDAPPLQVVAWADSATIVGVDPAGAVWSSADAGDSWQQSAHLDAAPHAIAARVERGDVRILVATEEALLESVDGGRSFTGILRS
ncbi:MAG: hypothetical protein JWP33_307 [Blastococcus sp.]|jgi:hypothetical protein|nr:hypothetical protein [Blastococcus sp.]